MIKYSVTDPRKLLNLCIKNNWFTCGTSSQYDKLFYANANGFPIDEIATIIWLCSDEECCSVDVLEILEKAHHEYIESFVKNE